MKISQLLKPAQNFFKKNLSAENDFGSVEENRQEAKRVDAELGEIHQDGVDISSKLGSLDQDSKLTPPSFKSMSNKQLILGATGAGALAGGVIGSLTNLTSGGVNTANAVQTTTVDIMEDSLPGKGFTAKVFTAGGTPSNPGGWEIDVVHDRVQSNKVGELKVDTLKNAAGGGILMSGLIGVGIGAGVGAGLGLIGVGVRKALKADYDGTPPRQTEGDTKVLIAGGAAGAAIGAGIGALSAWTNSSTVTLETQSIEMETKVLNTVPKGPTFYLPNNGEFPDPTMSDGRPITPFEKIELVEDYMDENQTKLARRGAQDLQALAEHEVTGQVPARNILGNLKIKTDKQEVSVGPGFMGSVLGGAAVGAVTGVAGGVLVNVLRKSL